MTEHSERAARGKAVGIHLAIVGLSFVLSFLVVPSLVPFDPEGAGADAASLMVLFGHGVAAIVALSIKKTSALSCAIVFFIASFFTGCFGVEAIQRWRYRRYQAPYDRFQDCLAPVPTSVVNLRFVSLEEKIRPDLMFQFDIDPADMDAILKERELNRVDCNRMLNPEDFFRYPYYLPVKGDYHIFQGKDKSGDVVTIKTNESHSHAIFRRERSDFYKERLWENGNPLDIERHNEKLKQLKLANTRLAFALWKATQN